MCRAQHPVTKASVRSDVVAVPSEIDLLYLFLCAVECRNRGSTDAVWELLAGLTSSDPARRDVARVLLNSC